MGPERWWVEALVAVACGAALVWIFRRAERKFRLHMEARLARAVVGPGGGFELRFTPGEAGPLLCYMRYKALVSGCAYHIGLRCRVSGRIGGRVAFEEDLGVLGDISNPPPLEYRTRVRTEYNVRLVSTMKGYRQEGTVRIGEFPVGRGGEEVVVSGAVTPNALTSLEEAEIYLVPGRVRL